MKTETNDAVQNGQPGEQTAVDASGDASERRARPMLLERFLANADIIESRHIVVDTTPEATWATLKSVDFAKIDAPLARGFLKLRVLAIRIARRRLGLRPLPIPARLTLENVEDYGQIKLAETPGAELVVGAIARPNDVESLFERRTPAEFVAFRCPGHVKVAAGFLVEPYGESRTLLSHEARARATDTKTRRAMIVVSLVTAPLMKWMVRSMLGFVKRTAEQRCASSRHGQAR